MMGGGGGGKGLLESCRMPLEETKRYLEESKFTLKAMQTLCKPWPSTCHAQLIGSKLTLHSTIADAQAVAEEMSRI